MLLASRDELEGDTRAKLLAIRWRELEFFTRTCNLVAQLSAIIAGYGYTALIYTKYLDQDLCDPNEFLCAEMTYPLCVTLTMSISIFALWGSMLITLLAPALALRGPQGSLEVAVDLAMQEYQYVLALLALALIMLLVSTAIWSMTQRVWVATVIITVIVVASIYMIYATSLRGIRRFEIPRPYVLAGHASTASSAACESGAQARPVSQHQQRDFAAAQHARPSVSRSLGAMASAVGAWRTRRSQRGSTGEADDAEVSAALDGGLLSSTRAWRGSSSQLSELNCYSERCSERYERLSEWSRQSEASTRNSCNSFSRKSGAGGGSRNAAGQSGSHEELI